MPEDDELMRGNTTALDMGDEEAISAKMSVQLRGLSKEQQYAITVCTIVNGHTIAKKVKMFVPRRT